MSIHDDIAALEADALVELFELDATALGGPTLYFHAGTNELAGKVVWQGQAYEAWPVEADGFEWNSKGTLPRPKLRISNIGGLITAYILDYDDMLGARVIRKRTLAKYLDAANFADGNPSADPDQYLADDMYYIFQKSGESKDVVEFTLASAMDVQGTLLPRRQIVQNLCPWKYKGPECGWVPNGKYYDKDGKSTTAAKDACSKRVDTGCKVRFGEHAPLPFGGFPASGLLKQ